MLGLIVLLTANIAPFELIKNKQKENPELTLEQKIDILAWRTQVILGALDELDAKINYVINNFEQKTKSHVSDSIISR